MDLNQCWFGRRPVHAELSPVESFHDANCRAYETDTCNRGDHCNFMHVRKPSKLLKGNLFRSQEKRRVLLELKALGYTGEPPSGPEGTYTLNETASEEPTADQLDIPKLESEPTTSVAAVAALFAK